MRCPPVRRIVFCRREDSWETGLRVDEANNVSYLSAPGEAAEEYYSPDRMSTVNAGPGIEAKETVAGVSLTKPLSGVNVRLLCCQRTSWRILILAGLTLNAFRVFAPAKPGLHIHL